LSTASGPGGEAAQPVREAHSEKPEKLPKNKLACFIGIFLAFLMPGSSLCASQAPGANCFLLRPSRIADWLLCSFLPREESAESLLKTSA